jgi:hypothetical protein
MRLEEGTPGCTPLIYDPKNIPKTQPKFLISGHEQLSEYGRAGMAPNSQLRAATSELGQLLNPR